MTKTPQIDALPGMTPLGIKAANTPANVTVTLEDLIDRHGLLHVVTGLEIVCDEKSDHIEANWQDKPLANLWRRAGLKAGRLVREIDDLGL